MEADEGFERVERTVSMVAANVYALLTGGLPALFLIVLYSIIWPDAPLVEVVGASFGGCLLLLLVLLAGGAVVHELLHGLTWRALGNLPPGSVEYGVKWRTLTPYAHSKAPMPIRAYRWGSVMPGLVLGLAPALLGLAVGSGALVVFGAFFIFAAGGDFLILWLIRDAPAGALVEDHPSRAGCYLLLPREPGGSGRP